MAKPTIGYITNQLDFQHVSEAFEARGTAGDKEVIVVWRKSNLQPAFGPAFRSMPGLVVWLCPEHDSASPIVRWEPEELQ